MLADLQTTLKQMIYTQGKIPADEVDITFEMPSKEWADSLIHPTINFYLFDIEENVDLRSTAVEIRPHGDRHVLRRAPALRIDLRFMVSALTTQPEDDYTLIWRTLMVMKRNNPLPEEFLNGSLRGLDFHLPAKVVRSADKNGVQMLDLWGSFELPPRPALLYIITLPLDLELETIVPVTFGRGVTFRRTSPESEASASGLKEGETIPAGESPKVVRGTVRNKHGEPLPRVAIKVEGSGANPIMSDSNGNFILRNVRSDTLVLQIARAGNAPQRVEFAVSSGPYDIVLD